MPCVRRGAGQQVIQADGRLLESHAGRAPSIKRRSLTPVPLGQPESYQLKPGSSETGASKVLSSTAPFPYPLLMTQRFTGNSATHRSESRFRSSTGWRRSSASGATCFNVGGHPGPNWLIPGDRGPRERGPRPLNSDR